LLLLPPGEGWDEGIDKEKCLFFNPLTLALSRRERGLKPLLRKSCLFVVVEKSFNTQRLAFSEKSVYEPGFTSENVKYSPFFFWGIFTNTDPFNSITVQDRLDNYSFWLVVPKLGLPKTM
jgi:hypothetical protein